MRKFVQFLLAGLLLLSIGINTLPQTAPTAQKKYVPVNVDRNGHMTDAKGKPISKFLFPQTTYDEKGQDKFKIGTATKRPKLMYIDESVLTEEVNQAAMDKYKEYLAQEPKTHTHRLIAKVRRHRGVRSTTRPVYKVIYKTAPVNEDSIAQKTFDRIKQGLADGSLKFSEAQLKQFAAELKAQGLVINSVQNPDGNTPTSIQNNQTSEQSGWFRAWVINPIVSGANAVASFVLAYLYWIIILILLVALIVVLRRRSLAGKPGLIRVIRDRWSKKEEIPSITTKGPSKVQQALYDEEEIAKDLKPEKGGWGAAEKLEVVNTEETTEETEVDSPVETTEVVEEIPSEENPDKNQIVLKPVKA